MFVILKRDPQKGFIKVKGGFKTSSAANKWMKKHCTDGPYKLWGDNTFVEPFVYHIRKEA